MCTLCFTPEHPDLLGFGISSVNVLVPFFSPYILDLHIRWIIKITWDSCTIDLTNSNVCSAIFLYPMVLVHNISLLNPAKCSCFLSGVCLRVSMPTAAQWRQSPVNCFFDQFWHLSAPMGMWASMWWWGGRFLPLWMLTTSLSLVWSAELT